MNRMMTLQNSRLCLFRAIKFVPMRNVLAWCVGARVPFGPYQNDFGQRTGSDRRVSATTKNLRRWRRRQGRVILILVPVFMVLVAYHTSPLYVLPTLYMDTNLYNIFEGSATSLPLAATYASPPPTRILCYVFHLHKLY